MTVGRPAASAWRVAAVSSSGFRARTPRAPKPSETSRRVDASNSAGSTQPRSSERSMSALSCSIVSVAFRDTESQLCVDESGTDTKTGKVIVRIDPRYFRPTEVETLLGDPSNARDKLGWVPKISFEELVQEMMQNDLELAERDALEAGTVWWEAELFSGRPDWHRLVGFPAPQLSTEEQAFLDGPTSELCRMVNDWEITEELRDLTWLCNRAQLHFREIMNGDDNFALDLEFKVDEEKTGQRAVYLKQARPLTEPAG